MSSALAIRAPPPHIHITVEGGEINGREHSMDSRRVPSSHLFRCGLAGFLRLIHISKPLASFFLVIDFVSCRRCVSITLYFCLLSFTVIHHTIGQFIDCLLNIRHVRAEVMSSPFFTPVSTVGGSEGTPYDSVQPMNHIRTLIIWDDGNTIIGFHLEGVFGDEPSGTSAGRTSGTQSRLDLQQAELVTSLTMWASSDGKSLSRIRITTSLGQTFEAGGTSRDLDATILPTGSGIIVGWSSIIDGPNVGGILNGLGFQFLMPLQSVAISIVKPSNDPSGQSDGISSISLSHATFSNPSAEAIKYTFQDTVTKTNTSQYSFSVTDWFDGFVTVQAPIYSIAAGATPTWQMSTATAATAPTSTDVALQWSLTGDLAQNTKVSCTASCLRGALNLNYRANVTLAFKDSSIPVATFTTAGVAKIIVFSNVAAGLDNAAGPI